MNGSDSSDSLNHRLDDLENLSNYSDKSVHNGGPSTSIYSGYQHAKPEVVDPIYETFRDTKVILCGPEYNYDFTYYLVHQCPDLMDLERAILIAEITRREEQLQSMEFRVIQKICCNKDHASNFFIVANSFFTKLNRHNNMLPYKHSRVKLLRQPFVKEP